MGRDGAAWRGVGLISPGWVWHVAAAGAVGYLNDFHLMQGLHFICHFLRVKTFDLLSWQNNKSNNNNDNQHVSTIDRFH